VLPRIAEELQKTGSPPRREFQCHLKHARTTSAEARIRLGHVRRLGEFAARSSSRFNDVVGLREIGMVEDVEEFGPQLHPSRSVNCVFLVSEKSRFL